jgi:glycosyltransferase involved in cell wall biosynthesis
LSFPELRLSANSAAGAHSYRQWLALPEHRVSTIPNGLLDGMLPPMDQNARNRLRESLEIPVEAPLIAGVFRLSDEKRPLLFVETAGLLLEAFPQAHVVLVGDGPRRADVAAGIGKLMGATRFHMVGSRSDATDFLGAADLVLHTAWAEGHPNVLMEAQLLGRPIVCAASHGTAECLYLSPAIRVEDTDDPALLAQAAAAILSAPDEVAAAASAARAWLLDRFSIARLVANSLEAAGVPCLDVIDAC